MAKKKTKKKAAKKAAPEAAAEAVAPVAAAAAAEAQPGSTGKNEFYVLAGSCLIGGVDYPAGSRIMSDLPLDTMFKNSVCSLASHEARVAADAAVAAAAAKAKEEADTEAEDERPKFQIVTGDFNLPDAARGKVWITRDATNGFWVYDEAPADGVEATHEKPVTAALVLTMVEDLELEDDDEE